DFTGGLVQFSVSLILTLSIRRNDSVGKGGATVPVALFGVSPNSWCGRFHSPFGAPRRVLPARRRDADGSGRDDRAPHIQVHRSTSTQGEGRFAHREAVVTPSTINMPLAFLPDLPSPLCSRVSVRKLTPLNSGGGPMIFARPRLNFSGTNGS